MLTVAESHEALQVAGLVADGALAERKEFLLEAGPYGVRLAVTERDRAEAYRLRFVVFNLELHEGLMSAYADAGWTGTASMLCASICWLRISGTAA